MLIATDGLGLQVGNTVLSAYIVDNYPDFANEIITFYSVIINVSSLAFCSKKGIADARQLSAFILPWFIYYWVEASGFIWTFVAQSNFCTLGVIPVSTPTDGVVEQDEGGNIHPSLLVLPLPRTIRTQASWRRRTVREDSLMGKVVLTY